MKKILNYFTKGEWALFISSVVLIVLSFAIFDRSNYLTLIASLIGAASLIFNAKGNPVGQALMIVFGVLYGIISYACAYYGEMITYLGMTLPMAVVSLVTWLKNPFKGKRSQVTINSIKGREWAFMAVLTVAVTVAFYFILQALNTANLIPSTISVATSFAAAYLTFRRTPWFSLAYAANDIVLIVLWVLATLEDISYLSVIVCFAMFLVNDCYSFINWRKMQRLQKLMRESDEKERLRKESEAQADK